MKKLNWLGVWRVRNGLYVRVTGSLCNGSVMVGHEIHMVTGAALGPVIIWVDDGKNGNDDWDLMQRRPDENWEKKGWPP